MPETSKIYRSETEWGCWYAGKESTKGIVSPQGQILEASGAVCDGGSFLEGIGTAARWNSAMDEEHYIVREWNECIAA